MKNGQHPPILKLLLAKKINLETFIILNSILKFAIKFNSQLSETVIWPDLFTKCKNYRPFLEYDVHKYNKVMSTMLYNCA